MFLLNFLSKFSFKKPLRFSLIILILTVISSLLFSLNSIIYSLNLINQDISVFTSLINQMTDFYVFFALFSIALIIYINLSNFNLDSDTFVLLKFLGWNNGYIFRFIIGVSLLFAIPSYILGMIFGYFEVFLFSNLLMISPFINFDGLLISFILIFGVFISTSIYLTKKF